VKTTSSRIGTAPPGQQGPEVRGRPRSRPNLNLRAPIASRNRIVQSDPE
jgi:hypothetical protein